MVTLYLVILSSLLQWSNTYFMDDKGTCDIMQIKPALNISKDKLNISSSLYSFSQSSLHFAIFSQNKNFTNVSFSGGWGKFPLLR